MEALGNIFFFQWEVNLIVWLQTNLGPVGAQLLNNFSLFGEELTLIFLVGFLYWSYDKHMARFVGICALLGLGWNTMAKNIFLRLRPYFAHEEVKLLRVVEPSEDPYNVVAQGYSMPSAHSTNVVSVFGSMAAWVKKRWMTVLAVVICFFTGLSRSAVGAHYPTDVMLGWCFGLLAIVLASFLQKRVKNTLYLFGILFLLMLPGFFYCKSEDFYTSTGLLLGFGCAMFFEENKVHFENTRKPLWMILRALGGLAIYVVLNKLMKMPFSPEFLSGGSQAALMIRFVRYAIIAFVDFGVYPLAFRLEKGKKAAEA